MWKAHNLWQLVVCFEKPLPTWNSLYETIHNSSHHEWKSRYTAHKGSDWNRLCKIKIEYFSIQFTAYGTPLKENEKTSRQAIILSKGVFLNESTASSLFTHCVLCWRFSARWGKLWFQLHKFQEFIPILWNQLGRTKCYASWNRERSCIKKSCCTTLMFSRRQSSAIIRSDET